MMIEEYENKTVNFKTYDRIVSDGIQKQNINIILTHSFLIKII